MKTLHETLVIKSTIANRSKAKVVADDIGVDAYASFEFAEKIAYEALYKYVSARKDASFGGENAVVDKKIVNNAFRAIEMMLDCIGEVNGHRIMKNNAMLEDLAECTIYNKSELVGAAYTQKSVVDNFKKQLKGGGNAEYKAKIEADLEVANIKLKELKKCADSADIKPSRRSFLGFRGAVELELGRIIKKQAAKTWEELEAEKEAKKAAKKAEREAQKAAKA